MTAEPTLGVTLVWHTLRHGVNRSAVRERIGSEAVVEESRLMRWLLDWCRGSGGKGGGGEEMGTQVD